ncbi:HK97 family phage prohead protease [Bradyrhizobium sp. GCM10023182]|uniref:HK97 family phage prohead protease n=1 Tax=Bradyrhizobium zhengyangense TaxID=2911009 RepID=A0ABS9LP11_9BRAD|nr:HK97 family phage prohead protease [Bradyrhizobium zhengyangense]MCG2668752.1 HK97 family phage prohead protease [Bradyrhizobium zhengyangense]
MKLNNLEGRRFAQSGAAPRTFNAERRTVDVVLSKGSAVQRSYGTERLRIAPDAVDLSRLESAGIPLLDSHAQRGISNAIGRFVRIWFEGDTLLGRVQFNETPQGEAALGMIERGEISAVSVGYIVSSWEITDAKGRVLDPDDDRIPLDGSLTFEATRWQVLEGSLVSVPADPQAVVRSIDGTSTPPAFGPLARMEARQRMIDAQASSPSVARQPRSHINPAARAESPQHITQEKPMSRIQIVRDERDGVADAMQIALTTRILASSSFDYQGPKDRYGKAHFEQHKEQARQYMDLSLVEMAAASIGYRGHTFSMSTVDKLRVFERAFNSTSDFPSIFSNALNKSLLARYSLVTPTYRELAVERPFKDFRPHPQVRAGDFPQLQEVQQNGELRSGTSGDASENVSITPYGVIFTISRQMLVNDDLGAIDQILGSAGETVLVFENDTFFKMFNSNPVLLTDSTAVFASGHGNLAGTGAAPSVSTVSDARQALRGMKSLSGNFLNVPPALIIAGPAQETVIDQLVASITPTLVGSVNPYAGKLRAISDANISDTSWYVATEPSRVPCFIYGFLNGANGPRTTIHSPFGLQGVKVSLEHDFGVGAIDYRGFYKNAGA